MFKVFLILLTFSYAAEITKKQADLLQAYYESNYELSLDFNLFKDLIDDEFESENPVVHISIYNICLNLDNLTCANTNLNKAIKLDSKNDKYRDLSFSLSDYVESLSRARKTAKFA